MQLIEIANIDSIINETYNINKFLKNKFQLVLNKNMMNLLTYLFNNNQQLYFLL